MLTSVRRIVTGHNQDGKSVVLFDTQAGSVLETAPGRGLTDLWVTDETPAQNAGGADAADRPIRLEPPAGGSVFRFFQVAPVGAGEELDAKERERRAEAAFAAMSAAHVRVDTARHPTMHKTATVDYIILISGRVTLLLDEGEVALQPGDVVVQRGTNHAWINRAPEPAVLAGVLIDAEPV